MTMHVTVATWNDLVPDGPAKGQLACPHLTQKMRDDFYEKIRTTEPHLLEVRTSGMPSFGAGLIYPCDVDRILIDPFAIPAHFLVAYAMDTGWNWNGVVWGAYDKASDILYITDVYKRGQIDPAVVVAAIQGRAKWKLPGIADAANKNQLDGKQVIQVYKSMGLDLELPNKALETGITQVWNRLSTGRLRIFRQCTALTDEMRTYMRGKHGEVKEDQDDHLCDACVTGDTKVFTDKGPVAIAELVGSTGRVLSRYGSWATYIGARKTIENSPTVVLSFSDGLQVRCTPDHPFLTPSGWVRADCMKNKSCYNGITQRIQWRNIWKFFWSRLFRQRFRNLTANVIGFVESIFNVHCEKNQCPDFIGSFGNTTMDQFQMDTTSIMPMKIEAIINYPILNANSKPNISAIISKEWQKYFRQAHSTLPLSGMDLRQGGNGIESTMNNSRNNFINKLNTSVNFVGKFLQRLKRTPTDSVPAIVNIGPVWRLALTMKNAFAWFVAMSLWLIVTLRKPAVRENAVVHCLEMSEGKNEDVYCLTVPGTSAFCLENGAVVHNTRYLVMSGIARAKQPPKNPDLTFDWSKRPASGPHGWMAN